MSYDVRYATEEDGEELVGLWHGFTDHLSEFDERYLHNERADERWLEYFDSQLVDSKYGAVVVAEHEPTGELVGVLEARVMGNHPIFRLRNHGYINGHYVVAEHRGEGVGSAMLELAHEWFERSEKDVDFYRVDVLHGDEGSESFYLDHGFTPVEHVYERTIDEA